ncbi:unnamed protein product [Pylaiella littoralis]
MEGKGIDSARSGRKRTQVGTTNRSTPSLSPKVPASAAVVASQGEDQGRTTINTSRGGTGSGVLRPRPASSRDVSVLSGSALLPSSPGQNFVDAKAPRETLSTLSTSRSVPSLGTSRRSQRLSSRGEKAAERKSTGEIIYSPENLAVAVNDMQTEHSAASNSYITSTQMAYMSGLHPPPSKVPIMDPYRHRQLLHDRWINRASQRLGDIAILKYGSVKEFFRLYDSNCDGFLDLDEFSEGITMCQLDHLFPRSLQRTIFDKIDKDKSGTIELHEFATFLGRPEDKGAPPGELSVWQKQEQQRKANDAETRSVTLQPIRNHKAQRIKNKLSYYLTKAVPNASAGLADNRTMFLKKQFALINEEAASRGINHNDLVLALGPKGMNLGVSEEDVRLLLKEMDTNSDGNVTLSEFAAFINLDDHEPLYQPLFDGRRRNVNILTSMVEGEAPVESPEETFFKARADQLHSTAVPSKALDVEVRMERERRAQAERAKLGRGRFARPESPAWTVDAESVTVSAPSGRTVVDIWDLPVPTRHLSSMKRSLTSSMRHLPRTSAEGTDGSSVSFASEGGPFAVTCPPESLSPKKKALRSLSSSHDLFSSLEETRMQDAAAGALARSRKVAKQTWADIGHGGIGDDAGTDESSSYYADPSERFTTTNSERYAPLIKMKKIERGQRSAGFCRQRPSDSVAEASRRQQKSENRLSKVRAHKERVSLSMKTEEVAARLKGERRVRGKARTRLRYNQWVNSMDNWLSDEVPKLADYDRRQFPVQNIRLRGGQQMHEALGGPRAIEV